MTHGAQPLQEAAAAQEPQQPAISRASRSACVIGSMWLPPGTSTSRPCGARRASSRPIATGASRSSSPCTTSTGSGRPPVSGNGCSGEAHLAEVGAAGLQTREVRLDQRQPPVGLRLLAERDAAHRRAHAACRRRHRAQPGEPGRGHQDAHQQRRLPRLATGAGAADQHQRAHARRIGLRGGDRGRAAVRPADDDRVTQVERLERRRAARARSPRR